jgi:hypothetical protein
MRKLLRGKLEKDRYLAMIGWGKLCKGKEEERWRYGISRL